MSASWWERHWPIRFYRSAVVSSHAVSSAWWLQIGRRGWLIEITGSEFNDGRVTFK